MTLPLTGIKVLDLSRLLPGPFCSQVLADFGAEVLKVEETGLGDYLRWFPPMAGEYSALFYSVNRSKQSMTLNLKHEQGREILRKLVAESDVLLESFRPGVMEKLGLGYDELKKINKRLIYCAITGYGRSGPYRDKVGHDLNYLNLAGITSLIGPKDGKPSMANIQIADIGGGSLWGVISILLALQAKQLTGEGQLCDVSMLDAVLSWLAFPMAAYSAAQEDVSRGNGLLGGGYACYNIYETSDHKYISLGGIEDKFWATVCKKLGREQYIEQRTNTEAQQGMIADFEQLFLQKTQAEWTEFFSDVDVCFTPVKEFKDLPHDPQIKAREMLIDTKFGDQNVTLVGLPVKLSQTPGQISTDIPAYGEHTLEQLRRLGYSEAQIEQLKQEKVI